MKRPSILTGIAFAFVVAVFTVPGWWGLSTALPFFVAFRLIALLAYLAYCFYLLRSAKSRVGTLTLVAINLAIGVGLSCLPVRTYSIVGVLVAAVSLNRSLLFHRSLVSMALDGFVSAGGLMFAGYLFTSTGSVPAALWSFFLLQSVFVLIPTQVSGKAGLLSADEDRDAVDPFVHGQRQAEAALQRIVQEGSN